MKIARIRTLRLATSLDPPFHAAWDPVPRTAFEATLVFVETDEGVTGVGSGDPPGWTEERRDFMLAEPTHVDPDGCVALPAGPGLGIELDDEALRRYVVR